MNTNGLEKFRNKIRVYRTDLDKVESGRTESFGALLAPLFDRKTLAWEPESFKKENHDTSELQKELAEVNGRFDEYIANNRKTYYDRLYADLLTLIDGYDPDGILAGGYEFESVIEDRTDIEMIIEEIKDVFDLKDLICKVDALDRILADKIPGSIAGKTYSPEDVPYAPANYWWLHLEGVYGRPGEVID